jgi:hypothetical protein
MQTRDFYIATLEKRAAEESSVIDNQEAALNDFASNAKDNRQYLGELFDNAGAVEKEQAKTVSKLFPGKTEKESGGQMLKLAARELFNDALVQAEEQGLLKTASAAYREVAFHAFCSELEKIAAIRGQTMGQLAHKNDVGSQMAKTWHVADPMETAHRGMQAAKPALAPAVQAMRAKASQPGIMGRVGGALKGVFGK